MGDKIPKKLTTKKQEIIKTEPIKPALIKKTDRATKAAITIAKKNIKTLKRDIEDKKQLDININTKKNELKETIKKLKKNKQKIIDNANIVNITNELFELKNREYNLKKSIKKGTKAEQELREYNEYLEKEQKLKEEAKNREYERVRKQKQRQDKKELELRENKKLKVFTKDILKENLLDESVKMELIKANKLKASLKKKKQRDIIKNEKIRLIKEQEEHKKNVREGNEKFTLKIKFYRKKGITDKAKVNAFLDRESKDGTMLTQFGTEANTLIVLKKNIKLLIKSNYFYDRTRNKTLIEMTELEKYDNNVINMILNIDVIDGSEAIDYFIISYCEALEITQILKEGEIEEPEPVNLQDIEYFNDIDNKAINNKYTEYYLGDGLVKNYYHEHIYLKDNFIKNSCGLTSLIYSFYDICSSRGYTELTYGNLSKILNIPYKKTGNMGIKIHHLQNLTQKYPFKIVVFDKLNQIINIFSDPNRYQNKHTAYLQVYDSHIIVFNNKAKLEELKKQELKVSIPSKISLKISPYYNILYSDSKDKINNTKDDIIINKYLRDTNDLEILICEIIKIGTPETKKIYNFKTGGWVINSLFFHILDKGYTPYIRYNRSTLNSITITSIKNIKINIETYNIESGYDNNENSPNFEYGDTSENIIKNMMEVIKYKEQFYKDIIKQEYISYPNNDVRAIHKEYKITVDIIRTNDEIYDNIIFTGLDDSKAYSSRLNEISEIPVIPIYNNYVKFDGSIKDNYFYIIERTDSEITIKKTIIFNGSNIARVYGILLKSINPKFYVIISQLETETIKRDFKKEIENICNLHIDASYKKDIINRIVGCLGIQNNSIYKSELFITHGEAITYKNLMIEGGNNPTIDTIQCDGKNTCYVVICEDKKETISNITPLRDMILTLQKIRILTNINILEKEGIKIYGVKTDCLMFNFKDVEKVKKIFSIGKNTSYYKSLGGYKIEHDKSLNDKMMEIFIKPECIIKSYTPIIKTFDDEFDNKAITNYIKEIGNVLILSKYAGCGKSFITEQLTTDKNKILYITPTNSLCKKYIRNGYKAITIYNYLGIDITGKKLHYKKHNEADIIVFDEIFLFGEFKLNSIYNIMESDKKTLFIATGDPIAQRQAIGEDHIRIVKMVNFMFKQNIYLEVIKRINDKEGIIKSQGIYNDIIINKIIDPVFICKKYGIKMINKIEDVKTDKNITFFRQKSETINNFIVKSKNINKYDIGQVLLVKKQLKTKTHTFHTNFEYNIVNNDEEHITLEDEEGEKHILKIKTIEEHFKLSFSITLDSLQGATIDEEYTIFDSENLGIIGENFLYTALTRTTNLKKITICILGR